MWLINCKTLGLEEFIVHTDKKYAILSHTWEKGEEVQHAEFRQQGAKTKRGWQKIEKTCELALADGYDYAWVDTCCIDKTSSAELTEAINSMFVWYSGAEICYAYLADYDASDSNTKMGDSKWFTRGWTLQELIAPARLRFHGSSWSSIGTKTSLSEQLSLITGIEEQVLLAAEQQSAEDILSQIPIARRMSWAAERETTRVEDIAYCLLGIFGINLPLLYGEGDRAFMRLQDEIVQNSNDMSILAWRLPADDMGATREKYCGVFARHPRCFKGSGNVGLVSDIKFGPEFTSTNKGLRLETLILYDRSRRIHQLNLNCQLDTGPEELKQLYIYLKHRGGAVYARAFPDTIVPDRLQINYFNFEADKNVRFLSKTITPRVARSLETVLRHSFNIEEILFLNFDLLGAKPENSYDVPTRTFITDGLRDFVGALTFRTKKHDNKDAPQFRKSAEFHVFFGFGYEKAPWVDVRSPDRVLGIPGSYYDTVMDSGGWAAIAKHCRSGTRCLLDPKVTGLSGAILGKRTKSVYVCLKQEAFDGMPEYWIRLRDENNQKIH